MNKITTINLGGYPITIDEDAYLILDKYLKTINRHFSKSQGCEEIVDDIETRMAELINIDLGGKPIVTSKHVEKAIRIMGKPELLDDYIEMGDEEFSIEEDFDNEELHESDYRTGKRLFRDKENKVIGGVCSGIATYFGVEDPLWIRLLFVAILFGGGISAPLYILLWIILPSAKSANDRLAMKGEKINIKNISDMVEREFTDISESILDLKDNYVAKKKEKSYRS